MPSVVPPPIRPDDSEDGRPSLTGPEQPPLFVRFGTAAAVGTVAALVGAVPGALRVSSSMQQPPALPIVLLALAGTALLPMILAVVVLRSARVGLRYYGGAEGAARGMGLLLWLLLALIVLTGFGAVLRATTHHHGLAGVTFSVVGGAALVGLALASLRLSRVAAGLGPRVRSALFFVAFGAFVGAIVLAGMRLSGSAGGAPSTARAVFVDLLAFALTALFASRPRLAGIRILALMGPPLAATLLVFGISSARSSRALVDATSERAPAVAPFVRLVGPSK